MGADVGVPRSCLGTSRVKLGSGRIVRGTDGCGTYPKSGKLNFGGCSFGGGGGGT